jgi:protein pelota
MTFMLETAVRREDAVIIANKSKFLKSHASSGHKKAIEEMLMDPSLRGQLSDVKAADEVNKK